nr:LysM peptidoglycan-binding domain-containing protein [Microbacterium atlanticum]
MRCRPAGISAAVVGSIALSLSAAPAHAHGVDAATRGPIPGALHGPGGAAALRTVSALPTPASFAARAAEAAPPTYTVQAGDTVSGIAARFGLRTADVLAVNGLGWSSIIQPGQVLTLTGAAAPAPAPTPAPAPAAASYTVLAGDTVSSIARQHGTTVDAVLSANGLARSSIIYPGQTLAIPGAAAPAASAPPPAAAPQPAPGSSAGSYTVAAGDTVSGIAGRHGVSVDAVLAANGLDRSSIIYPGQTLRIPGSAPSLSGLTAEQTANAQLIARVGRQLGLPDRAIAIALGTAMQESSLRNLGWGDRDSLGLFQQRPSHGWGSETEVQDAERATRVFFGGAGDPNGGRTRGLLDISGWESMSFAQAAQAVQISAYPDAYAKWEAPAYEWLAALG